MPDSALPFTLAGEEVAALAERALLWPAERTLFVADVHFGKDATFRQALRFVPPGTTSDDLSRLATLTQRHQVRRLVILGDVFHSEHSGEEMTLGEIERFRPQLPREVWMVPGNHDRRALGLAEQLDFSCLAEGDPLGPWSLRHHPAASRNTRRGYVLCGHLHPCAGVRGAARQSLRLPCFWAGKSQCVLPAFGGFTGGSFVRPREGDRVILIAGQRLLDAAECGTERL